MTVVALGEWFAGSVPGLVMPARLARFVFEQWSPGVVCDEPGGVLAAYVVAESAWGTAVRNWRRKHGVSASDVRALVEVAPDWVAFLARVVATERAPTPPTPRAEHRRGAVDTEAYGSPGFGVVVSEGARWDAELSRGVLLD